MTGFIVQRQAGWLLCFFLLLGGSQAARVTAQAADQQISQADFRRVVAEFLATREFPKNQIVSQRDVVPLFVALEKEGMVLNRKELLKRIPADESALVKLLRSNHGRKFMAKVANNKLIFDRLDRLTKEPGGERMLRDLMKLPDASRYAKIDTGPGVPDMIDFLPKRRSSKTRRVKDYEKPTGNLYTIDAVIDFLAKQVAE